MPLDDAARNYAKNLFQKKQDEILKAQSKEFSDVASDFARRGLTTSGLYLSACGRVLLNQARLLAEARKESLIQAYAKSGLPFDDAALSEIKQEVTDFCEGHRKHATAALLQMLTQTFGGGAPANLGTALSAQIESGMSGIKAGLLRDLSIMRDEEILAARSSGPSKTAVASQSVLSSSQEPGTETAKGTPNGPVSTQTLWNRLRVSNWTRDQKIGIGILVFTALGVIVTLVVPELRKWTGLDRPSPPAHQASPPVETKPGPTLSPRKPLVAETGKTILDLRKRHSVNPLPQVESEKSFGEIPAHSYSFISGLEVVHDHPPNYMRASGFSRDFEVHKLGDGTAMILGFVGAESLVRLQEGMPQGADVSLYSGRWGDAPNIVAIPLSEIKCDRSRTIDVADRLVVGVLDCKVNLSTR
jgi:hypothetical protein